MDDLVERFLKKDRRALARIISRVENETPEGREYLRLLFPHSGKTHIIGITGGAGSGKSTLTGALAAASTSAAWRDAGHLGAWRRPSPTWSQ